MLALRAGIGCIRILDIRHYSLDIVASCPSFSLSASETENISAILERNNFGNRVVLANERGDVIGGEDLPGVVESWFLGRFQERGAAAFFAASPQGFQVGASRALWERVDIRDSQQWYLVFMYDQAAFAGRGGLWGWMAGWATGVAATC